MKNSRWLHNRTTYGNTVVFATILMRIEAPSLKQISNTYDWLAEQRNQAVTHISFFVEILQHGQFKSYVLSKFTYEWRDEVYA